MSIPQSDPPPAPVAGSADPVVVRHRDLEQIAMVALRAGRLLMESGARAEVVQQGAALIARALGAQAVHFRVGYASLAITVQSDANTITRMTGVGRHGVDLRLNHALRRFCAEVAVQGGGTVESVDARLSRLVAATPHHSWGWVALAVGLACAAFGRLLGIDLAAFLPVLAGSAIGQALRHFLLKGGTNGFVTAAVVSFASAAVAGLAARHLGSGTVDMAMTAAVLLLVPGVPVLNAQTDIMEGHPTLGSARAVSVMMALVFITVGIWLAEALLAVGASAAVPVPRALWHQALFGAIAAAGFGVLFNFDRVALLSAAGAGALAVAVRTWGLDLGWSLEAASFAAAAVVGGAVELMRGRIGFVGNALAVAGCIPMIPGSAAAKCILGLLALTAPDPAAADQLQLMLATVESSLRVLFTIGAIGAGLTIATELLRRPDFGS